jgi:hypothetical protein
MGEKKTKWHFSNLLMRLALGAIGVRRWQQARPSTIFTGLPWLVQGTCRTLDNFSLCSPDLWFPARRRPWRSLAQFHPNDTGPQRKTSVALRIGGFRQINLYSPGTGSGGASIASL